MKKIFVALMLGLAAGTSAMAQNTIVNNPDNRSYFGIRVGGEVTCPGKVSLYDVSVGVYNNGGGVELGGIYNLPVVANFYIEPGLKFYYNTYAFKKEFIEDLQDDIIINGVSLRKFGMRIPVMAGYHFDFTEDIKVSVFTGPELEVGFSAKQYATGHNIDMSASVYGDGGGMHRVNVLWGFGAGVSYQHFYFGVSGGIGMVNMFSDTDEKFHENRVTFSLGYNF
ncbi:MAG: PorT family protein [Muribaculaceae bacterium]|nr:PorT family protein [Muribaculaceae bacterium]